MTVPVILLRRELLQIPLVAVLVVVVHRIVDDRSDLVIGIAVCDEFPDLVLHVTEKALPGCVVPAVSLPGHGLNERSIPELPDEGVAGIVAALIAVDDGRAVQLGSVLAAHSVDHVKDEVNPKIVAEPVGQHFMGTEVKDRGQIADTSSVKEVGDVGQQGLPRRIAPKLTVDLVACHMACLHGTGHTAVGVCLTNRAEKIIFQHQAADFLNVHDYGWVEMQQPHVDAPGTFLVSAEFIGLFHQSKIRAVRFFPALSQRGGLKPGIVPRP